MTQPDAPALPRSDAPTSPADPHAQVWAQIEQQFAAVLGGLPTPRTPGDTP